MNNDAVTSDVVTASGDERSVYLNEIAFARPGDKGNDADITVFARSAAAYAFLVDALSAEAVADHFGEMVTGDVQRWEVPNVWALKFLLRDALAGGGPASLRADNLGKALGGAILRLRLRAPSGLVGEAAGHDTAHASQTIHPPPDPYVDADWRI